MSIKLPNELIAEIAKFFQSKYNEYDEKFYEYFLNHLKEGICNIYFI